ncbi:hypothetical protein HHK36_008198 [Tetracentron sinense]|uniref:Uncharacterized protein n=1 Tax=Tetracentron sinense TaxID=13715 RepID=A0A834ZJ37_TETSI|nr:hypothetical protein HHK36_008198 [Tetracentron sinense]
MAKEVYGEQNNIARTYQIKQELMSLKKGNKPFNEFVGELSSLFDELEFYVPLITDAKKLQKQKEQDKIFALLAALPSDYEMIRSQILMTSELSTLSSVCATIAREETRRKVMSDDLKDINILEQSEKFALKANSSSENVEISFVANNTGSRGRGRGRKDTHVAQSADNETPITMEKLAQFFNQFGKVNIASTSPSCDSDNPSSFLSNSLSNTLIIDSGATDHMSKSNHDLTSLHTDTKNIPVSIANGSLILDRGTGKKIGEGQQVRGLYVLDHKNKVLFSSNKSHDYNSEQRIQGEYPHNSHVLPYMSNDDSLLPNNFSENRQHELEHEEIVNQRQHEQDHEEVVNHTNEEEAEAYDSLPVAPSKHPLPLIRRSERVPQPSGDDGEAADLGRPALRAAPRAAPVRNPPQPASPTPPPALAQGGSGGSMIGGLGGTIAQGVAFGTGSAVAHRAVDAGLNNYGSDISKCQFYLDMLSECRKNSGTRMGA